MVVSSVKDNLKLLFSDKYKISDSDYNSLSEILISNGVSEIAFDGGLVQTIKLLHETGAKFPMTVNFLQYLWKDSFITYNFVKSLVPMVSNGIFKLRKVSKEKLKSGKILNDLSLEDENQDKFVVVYSTDKFNIIYKQFSSILSNYKFELKSYLNEGVSIAPQRIRYFIDRSNKLLSNMRIKASIESYMKDDSEDIEEVNIILSGTSDYAISSNDIQRKSKKYLNKISYVNSSEIYKESESELFLGLTLSMQNSYKEIPIQIFNLVHDLELNGVSTSEEV